MQTKANGFWAWARRYRHVWQLSLALLAGVSLRVEAQEQLRYHRLVVDGQDLIVPWYAPRVDAFDNYLTRCWQWAVAVPNDAHGLPISFLYCAWHPGDPPTLDPGWENDVGEKIPNWVESARLFYQYSGDRAPLDYVRRLVDYSLDHGQTPANHQWPAFPVGTSNAGDTEFRGFTGAWNLWDCHVDLAADIGWAMYSMYQMYGDARYRDKAIQVADLLASKMVAGTATDSPWPYVINSQTGANRSRYAASWDGALLLFDGLIADNQGNVTAYTSARTTLKNWLLAYPMQNGNWVDGHSDVYINGTTNWSTTCASDMCLYLLDHPDWDANFLTDVPRLIQWTVDNFVTPNTPDGLAGEYHGAYVPAEQTAFNYRMGYQAARLGAQYAGWYAVTGDPAHRDRAYRCFAYNTYMMQASGQSSDGPTDTVGWWWSDCYGEATRMYYYGLAAVPEWAPPDQNHLLHSSTVVTAITYGADEIAYTTWNAAATEKFRLASPPTAVLANGVPLPVVANLTAPGWTFDPATGVLRVRHEQATQIQVLLGAAPPVVTVTVNGTQPAQTIAGLGVNINAAWWLAGNYGDATVTRPAIDRLIAEQGASLFRVVIEEMDWEATNDNGDAGTFNWPYYNSVFTNARFTGVWNTLRYLNQKGITERLMISFMGAPPSWMGSNYTVDVALEDEFVEAIAALLYYARNTAGVQFTLVSPLNETELDGREGPNMKDPVQVTRILAKLGTKLDALGMGDVRFVAPDAAGGGMFDSCFEQMIQNTTVMGKLARWGVHNYGGDSTGYWNKINGSAITPKEYWVTETAVIENLLTQLDDGNVTAFMFWDGFDCVYQHGIRNGYGDVPPNDWVFWEGERGKPLLAYEAATQQWTPRKQYYEFAQVFKFIRPGAQRVAVVGAGAPLTPLLAFKHDSRGEVVLVGRNSSGAEATLVGTLAAVPAVPDLQLYYTSATANLAYGGRVLVSGQTFSVTLPAACVFTLIGGAAFGCAITAPAPGATFTPPATIPLAAAAWSTTAGIAQVEFFSGTTLLGTDSTAPYELTWPSVPVGTYALTARATDTDGNSVVSAAVTVSVATAAGGRIGNNADGTATDTIWDNGPWINAARFTATASFSVDTMHAKIGALTGRYQCAIYSADFRLLRSTTEVVNPASDGWYDFPLTAALALTNGSDYWLAIWSDSSNARVYYTLGGVLRWGRYDYGAWPDPLAVTGSGTYNYCLYASGPPPNQQPVIDSAAWADPNPVTLPAGTTVHVAASDPDGDPLGYAWTKVSGAGTVTFAAPAAAASGVTFSTAGTDVLRVTVSDGRGGSVASDVTVTVNPGAGVDPRADVNADGVVNALDLQIVIANFGRTVGSPGCDARADANADSVVNALDLQIVIANFGQTVP